MNNINFGPHVSSTELSQPKLKKKESEEPAIDSGFDFVNFPNLSVDE